MECHKITMNQLFCDTLKFLLFLHPFFIPVFRPLDTLIERHGDQAQQDDGGNDHMHLEDLRTVDDQISQPPSGSKEFSDDNADQGKPDIYLYGTEQDGDTVRKDYF